MKKQYYAIVCLLIAFTFPRAQAQMVGDCTFLKGNSLEIGISPLGSFGSSQSAPSALHPNGSYSLWDPGSSSYVSSRLLGFVADPAQDGWTAGAPPMFGDFFLPGTPQEGWSIQVNGVQSNAWTQALQFGPGTGFSGTLTGANFSYSNSGGVATAVWKGQATSNIKITQTTTLNATKLYFIVNVVIKNIGAGYANNVYYQRTLDPDNEEEQTSSYNTTNHIANQLPNPGNKVLVTSAGITYTAAFLGLGTKDCRAKCYILNTGLTPSYPLDQIYAQTTPYMYATGTTYTDDVGMGLVYSLGNIAPGDSTSLTFAYIMRAADLDSALNVTAPTLSANASLINNGDTINACVSGLDSIPVTIGNGTGYTWTWSPGTGLTSTTGTSSTVIVDSLTGITTYTIIGTPTSAAVCANDTFHFTIVPGATAGPAVTNVSYCQNETASPLSASGTGLLWYTTATGGVGSSTSPTPITTTPGVFTWWVSQHLGSCPESVRVPITVTVNPLPHSTAGSNSPICNNGVISLSASDTFTVSATYLWTGPSGYSSTLKSLSIIGPDSLTRSGWYYLTVTVNGCTGTDSTHVVVHNAPIVFGFGTSPSACGLSNGSILFTGLFPSTTYDLSYTYNGTTYWITITTSGSGSYDLTGLPAGIYSSITFRNSFGCFSNPLTISLPDGAGPAAPLVSSNSPICAGDTLKLFASSTLTGITYQWVGPNAFSSTQQNPMIANASTLASGLYYVTIKETATGCTSVAAILSVTVNPIPVITSVTSNSPVCAGSTLILTAVSSALAGTAFSWSGPSAYTGTGAVQTISSATVANSGIYTVVATANGCSSLPLTTAATVNPIPALPIVSPHVYCQYDAATALTVTGGNTWYTMATGGTGSNTSPTPSTGTPGVFTWYVSETLLGCESARMPISVTVNPTPVVAIVPVRSYICQHDTLTVRFAGAAPTGATYSWGFPAGATVVSGDPATAGPLVVRFDSGGNNQLTLTVTANGCASTNYYTVHVVPTPEVDFYISPEVCQGDTTTLALSYVSPGINAFSWNTDSTHLHVITASGTLGGGPFSVSWDSAGIYVIKLTAYSSQEVCASIPVYDTVMVHPKPDASFTHGAISCIGDSVLFTATTASSSLLYTWGPSGFFSGALNLPSVYGTVLTSGYVTLTVTDPYGCKDTDSEYVAPGGCCRIWLPDAFTPNGDGHNDRFRCVSHGHHNMGTFRIVNRWGTTVYETTSTDDEGWDGTCHGVPQDMGVYYWYTRFTCEGHTEEQHGSVTLIR